MKFGWIVQRGRVSGATYGDEPTVRGAFRYLLGEPQREEGRGGAAHEQLGALNGVEGGPDGWNIPCGKGVRDCRIELQVEASARRGTYGRIRIIVEDVRVRKRMSLGQQLFEVGDAVEMRRLGDHSFTHSERRALIELRPSVDEDQSLDARRLRGSQANRHFGAER